MAERRVEDMPLRDVFTEVEQLDRDLMNVSRRPTKKSRELRWASDSHVGRSGDEYGKPF
ncbi:hypothetical protein OAJ60_02485 [Planctomycetaceae bacterium]|nr:hypothetical protein [Planctomycetaceae bacterium]